MDDLGLELKFAGGGPMLSETEAGVTVIEGYASLFGLTDQGGDAVLPGAFAASLARLAAKGDKVRMLWQHDPTKPIGVWTSVREDEKGLHVEGKIWLTLQQGKEAYEMLKGGIIDGLSIGYRVERSKRTAAGRELWKVALWEISLVTFPMLIEGRVSGVKAYEDGNFAMLKRDVEKLVRDAGFSTAEAKAAAAGAADGLMGARDAAERPSASEMADLIRQIATS